MLVPTEAKIFVPVVQRNGLACAWRTAWNKFPCRAGIKKSPKGTFFYSGKMGIRTPGGISATHPFQGCTLNHSDIFPKKKSAKKQTRETDRVRTCDLHLRRVALYPAELQSQKNCFAFRQTEATGVEPAQP